MISPYTQRISFAAQMTAASFLILISKPTCKTRARQACYALTTCLDPSPKSSTWFSHTSRPRLWTPFISRSMVLTTWTVMALMTWTVNLKVFQSLIMVIFRTTFLNCRKSLQVPLDYPRPRLEICLFVHDQVKDFNTYLSRISSNPYINYMAWILHIFPLHKYMNFIILSMCMSRAINHYITNSAFWLFISTLSCIHSLDVFSWISSFVLSVSLPTLRKYSLSGHGMEMSCLLNSYISLYLLSEYVCCVHVIASLISCQHPCWVIAMELLPQCLHGSWAGTCRMGGLTRRQFRRPGY